MKINEKYYCYNNGKSATLDGSSLCINTIFNIVINIIS